MHPHIFCIEPQGTICQVARIMVGTLWRTLDYMWAPFQLDTGGPHSVSDKFVHMTFSVPFINTVAPPEFNLFFLSRSSGSNVI
jgi:hypothetical protein